MLRKSSFITLYEKSNNNKKQINKIMAYYRHFRILLQNLKNLKDLLDLVNQINQTSLFHQINLYNHKNRKHLKYHQLNLDNPETQTQIYPIFLKYLQFISDANNNFNLTN